LLNNAIKYSWTKGTDRNAHIDIYVERKRNQVEIIIENWGVPIRKEELQDNQIFQFGRRGVEADDRGRSGTGIGLYDANEIITQHNGELRLTSEPTIGNPPEVYSNPFITRAYITLPTAE
jgi:signal transduction histidine kinase